MILNHKKIIDIFIYHLKMLFWLNLILKCLKKLYLYIFFNLMFSVITTYEKFYISFLST